MDPLEEELRAYFDLLVDRLQARGMSLEEARRQARLEMEGVEQVKEKVRDSLRFAGLREFARDVRFALRWLRRSPAFAAVTVLTLALGIGVNTAVFSVVWSVLLRPLPYDHSERLGVVWAAFHKLGTARAPVSDCNTGCR